MSKEIDSKVTELIIVVINESVFWDYIETEKIGGSLLVSTSR